MNENQRSVLVGSWVGKSDSAFQDARLLFENGRLASCVNRLYYAVFYAASAVLAFRGQSYGKHSAVRSAVHRDFINSALLDKEQGRIYDILLSRREQSDYQPSVVFAVEEVGEYLDKASIMIGALKKIIGQ
ncbi:MAG: HEPN domain-containing protein [Chitinivibrionales bacterium]|nr:HEPN domain-containing protein [Chitinivibrionales bacterium]